MRVESLLAVERMIGYVMGARFVGDATCCTSVIGFDNTNEAVSSCEAIKWAT